MKLLAKLWGPRPSQEFCALTLIILAGGQAPLRDLAMYLATGAIPQGVSCLHHACL